jgi:predicted metal-dependent phosphoesterase TrpH
MATADLHLHTTYSDGRFTPSELVDAAVRAGLRAIAVTDHDHTGGLPEARRRASSYRLEVLTGVEINAVWQDREWHVLGYCFDETLDWWESLMREQRGARARRMERFLERLHQLGVSLSMEDVARHAAGGALGRPHLAQALVAAGVVSSEQQAFDQFIGAGARAHVPREGLSPVEAVRAIRRAGGVASLAHPKGLPLEEGSLLDELVEAGLGGLEVVHPSLAPVLRDYYRSLAESRGLLWTGGTDDHGPREGQPSRIGSDGVPYTVVEALKSRAG